MKRWTASLRHQSLALIALVLLVYANSFDNSFHFDDHHSIERNTAIRSLISVPEFFTDGNTFSADPDVSMYRPLLLVTYAVNHTLGGIEPAGYHVANALFHACFVLLAFHAGCRLTGRARPMWWAAALLAVHPLNSQAVNYVSSRSGMLAAIGALGAFWLLSLSNRPRPLPAALSQLGGLLAKSTALAGVGLVAVYEAGRRGSRWRAVPALLVATVLYIAAAWWSGFYDTALDGTVRPLFAQLLTQWKALAFYLYLLASPVHLSIAHPFQVASAVSWAVVAGAMLTLSLLALSAAAWRRRHPAGFGVLWFYGGLALTSIMPLYILVSEHRLYLSLAGVAVLGATIWRGPVRWPQLLPALLLICLATLTVQRNDIWQSEYELWSDALRRNPQETRILSGMGEAHYHRGDLDSASVYYRQALERQPDNEVVWNNLGVLHENAGRLAEAEASYREALRLRPQWPAAQANLGRLLLQDGRVQEAAPLLGQAAARSPSTGVLVQLGVAAARDGRRDVAEQALVQALQLQPTHGEALVNLAALYLERALETEDGAQRQQDLDRVLQLSAQAIAQDTASRHRATARLNEAAAYAAMGRTAQARARYEGLLAEQADFAAAHEGYGRLLLELGDAGAAEALRRAIDAGAASARVWQDLGAAEAARGRWGAASAAFLAATELTPQDPAPWYNLGEVLFVQFQQARDGRSTEPFAVARQAELRRQALRAYTQVERLQPAYRGARQRLRLLEDAER